MTEAEWLECKDPKALLETLQGWASERKFRLFACGCSRRIWQLLETGSSRNAVVMAERHADDDCSDEDLQAANQSAHREVKNVDYGDAYWADLGCMVSHENTWEAARFTESIVGRHGEPHGKESRTVHSDLLRDIFGNPFRPVSINPSWLTSTVLALAQGIYQERAFDRLLILADALQDAGCEYEDILNHFRNPNATHVRGCWALDLVLGKS